TWRESVLHVAPPPVWQYHDSESELGRVHHLPDHPDANPDAPVFCPYSAYWSPIRPDPDCSAHSDLPESFPVICHQSDVREQNSVHRVARSVSDRVLHLLW